MSIETILIIAAIINFVIIPSFKDRVMPVKKLLLTPAIFMYFFYQTANTDFHASMINGIILMGMFMGIVIGMFMRKNTLVKSDKDQSLIWLPGSYQSLITFTSLFTIHYLIGYLQAVDPAYLTQASFGEGMLLLTASCVSSITIGANALLFFKYLSSESSVLQMQKKPRF